MCESFKSLGLLRHTNPDKQEQEQEEQERDPFLGGLRHAKIKKRVLHLCCCM